MAQSGWRRVDRHAGCGCVGAVRLVTGDDIGANARTTVIFVQVRGRRVSKHASARQICRDADAPVHSCRPWKIEHLDSGRDVLRTVAARVETRKPIIKGQ